MGKQRSAPTSPEHEDSESLSGESYDSYSTTPCSSLHSRSQTPIANQQTNPADQNSQVDNNASLAPKTILPPPFFLTIKSDHPWKTIAKELYSIKGHEDVTAKTTTKPHEIKLNCHDEQTFRSVQAFPSSIKEKVGYHTHALPTQRNLKIVIKGLPLDLTNEEITEELTNLGYKPIFIRAFIKNEKRLSIHQVTLTDIESANTIYQERQLFYVNVKIESYKSTGPIQCFTSQDFGHSSSKCNHSHRCVKCGGNNASNSCSKPKEVTPTCCNCGGEHTANYRGCPYLTKLVSEKTKSNTKVVSNQSNSKSINFPPLPTTQGKLKPTNSMSYANAQKNSEPTLSVNKTIQIIQKLLKSAQNCLDLATKDEIITTIMLIITELSVSQNE